MAQTHITLHTTVRVICTVSASILGSFDYGQCTAALRRGLAITGLTSFTISLYAYTPTTCDLAASGGEMLAGCMVGALKGANAWLRSGCTWWASSRLDAVGGAACASRVRCKWPLEPLPLEEALAWVLSGLHHPLGKRLWFGLVWRECCASRRCLASSRPCLPSPRQCSGRFAAHPTIAV